MNVKNIYKDSLQAFNDAHDFPKTTLGIINDKTRQIATMTALRDGKEVTFMVVLLPNTKEYKVFYEFDSENDTALIPNGEEPTDAGDGGGE